jgi:hypothetical protein
LFGRLGTIAVLAGTKKVKSCCTVFRSFSKDLDLALWDFDSAVKKANILLLLLDHVSFLKCRL